MGEEIFSRRGILLIWILEGQNVRLGLFEYHCSYLSYMYVFSLSLVGRGRNRLK